MYRDFVIAVQIGVAYALGACAFIGGFTTAKALLKMARRHWPTIRRALLP